MKTLIVYESMFGSTRAIAEAIGAGAALGDGADVEVLPTGRASPDLLGQADLVVVGGPTHVHSMSRPSTRKSAADMATKPDSELSLDPDARGPGVREWLDGLGPQRTKAAAFDTRIAGAAAMTGRASKVISRRLRRHGLALISPPESFLVGKDNALKPGELEHAKSWGRQLAESLTRSLHPFTRPGLPGSRRPATSTGRCRAWTAGPRFRCRR